MPTTDGTWRAETSRDATRRWPVVPVLIALVLFFLAVALFLAVRRVAGALVEPLPTGPLLATAAILLAWVWAVRTIGARVETDKSARRLLEWLPLVAMLLVAAACSYPGNRWLDWVVWLPALSCAWLLHDTRVLKYVRLFKIAGSPRDPGSGFIEERGSSDIEPTDLSNSIQHDGQLLQQLTRIRLAEGREAVHGVLLAEFGAGQQIATLYVGFCPPFEELPYVEAEVADGPMASIKVVQVLHNGAQLDVGLAVPATEAALVSVEFMAAERGEDRGSRIETPL